MQPNTRSFYQVSNFPFVQRVQCTIIHKTPGTINMVLSHQGLNFGDEETYKHLWMRSLLFYVNAYAPATNEVRQSMTL